MTADKSRPDFPFVADIAFQAGDIVFATDRFGRVVYWNGEAEAISGYKPEDVLGKPYTLAFRIEPNDAKPDLSAIIAGRDFAGAIRCHPQSRGEILLYLFATAGHNPDDEPAGVVFVGRDVTGLWQADDVAQATADKYRELFQMTFDAVAIAGVDGRIVEANPAYLRMYGYSAQDVKGMGLMAVAAPEDRSAAADAMASLAAGRPVNKTIRVRRKDGTKFVVDLVASVTTVGGERRIMGVMRDASGRDRAEQARSQSERMYRMVFESANDAVFVEAVDGRILDVNRNGCELLGYSREELLGMSVSDVVPPDARAWLPRVTDAILRDGTFRSESVRVHRSGRQVSVELSASTMELDGRTVILSIVRDITARKLAEQTLRESEEKFRNVSEQSPNMIFINSRGQVVYANQKSADVMGYTREEFYAPGFDFMKLIAPESIEEIKTVYARHARGEEVEPYEYSLITRDGRRIESIITTKLIEYSGTKAILGIVTDITERRAAERALLESERQYHTALDAMHDPIHVADADLRIVMVNQAFLSWLAGRGMDQAVLGKTVFEAFPFLSAKVREEYRHVFDSGRSLVTDDETTVAGRTFFTETTKVPVTEGGKVIRVLTVIRDTTERRAAELALRAEKERSQTYLALAGVMLVALDASGSITLLNRRACEVLGVAEAEALGRNWFANYVPEAIRAEVKATFASLMAGNLEPIEHYQNPVLTASGEERLIVWHNALLNDEQGRPTGTLSSGEDVTERERALKALRESEEKYRSVVERASDGICIIQKGRLKYVNRALAEMAGYTAGELIGTPFIEYLHPEDREAVADRYRRRLENEGPPSTYKVRYLRRDGSTVLVEVNAAMSVYEGTAADIILVRDISER